MRSFLYKGFCALLDDRWQSFSNRASRNSRSISFPKEPPRRLQRLICLSVYLPLDLLIISDKKGKYRQNLGKVSCSKSFLMATLKLHFCNTCSLLLQNVLTNPSFQTQIFIPLKSLFRNSLTKSKPTFLPGPPFMFATLSHVSSC